MTGVQRAPSGWGCAPVEDSLGYIMRPVPPSDEQFLRADFVAENKRLNPKAV
jgi:hypothetical protein